MPNNVQNKLECIGIKELDIFSVIDERPEKIQMDFDKILPMLKSLDLPASSFQTTVVEYVMAIINKEFSSIDKYEIDIQTYINDNIKCNVLTEEYREYPHIKTLDEAKLLGLKYLTNTVLYGCQTWYEWRTVNWGTKWNAYETDIEDNLVSFKTAWSSPIKIIEKLSAKYPDLEFTHTWADEDAGYNTGRAVYRNGEIEDIKRYAPNSQEAYKAYLHCWEDDEYIKTREDGTLYYAG